MHNGSSDMLPVLYERTTTTATRFDPSILTLAQSAEAYIVSKRRRLTASSEDGYRTCLKHFARRFPTLCPILPHERVLC